MGTGHWPCPLGSPNGGRGEVVFDALAHFHVQNSSNSGRSLVCLFSALLLLFRPCNLASANQLLHPVTSFSFFPRRPHLREFLLFLHLISVSLYLHQSELQSTSCQDKYYTISMGFHALPPLPQLTFRITLTIAVAWEPLVSRLM